MSPAIQWALVVLGFIGAAGTWFRAWVAWRERKASHCRWISPVGRVSL